MDYNYIVIIPARNEEIRLPSAIDSITRQTVLPILCLIINDGSDDNTPAIIKEYEQEYKWICHIETEHKHPGTWNLERDDIPHFARILIDGINRAKIICREQSLFYDFIAKVDADMILPPYYFEEIIKVFELNQKLGIASGDLYYTKTIESKNSKDINPKILDDTPSDGARIYRAKCYEEIGGIPAVGGPDSAALAIARTLGWETARIRAIPIYATRKSIGGGKTWKGYKLSGYIAYSLDYHPFLVLLKVFMMLLEAPHYHAIAYLSGFTLAKIKKTPKVEDQRIRQYYHKQRLPELVKMMLKNPRGNKR